METKYDAYHERDILYKITFEELCAANEKNGRMREEEILAYIRHRGTKFRCLAMSAVRGIMSPLGLMCSSDDERMVLCRLVTGEDRDDFKKSMYNPLVEDSFHENSWYSAYKLAITPVEFEGVVDKYYVADFCSLVNKGLIEIWEPQDE